MRMPTKTDGWKLGQTTYAYYACDGAHGVETLLVSDISQILRLTPEEAIAYGNKLIDAGSKALTKQRQLEAKE